MDDEITSILRSGDACDRAALDRAVPLIYDQLRAMAHGRLTAERSDHTLNTTALVHEAYLTLADQTRVRWQCRAHFFAIAARAMRRILLDYARRHGAAKRGCNRTRISLQDADLSVSQRAHTLIEVDDALVRLDRLDRRLRQVVEWRFFGGMSENEIAAALGVSSRTVRRDWSKARALLHAWLAPEGQTTSHT